MTEVRRAVNTFYVLDGGYCVTEGIAKDKGKYFEAVLATDYDALAARVQAVENLRADLQSMTEARNSARADSNGYHAERELLKRKLAAMTAERDAFKAVLQGAEYEQVDKIGTLSIEVAQRIGVTAAHRTKEIVAQLAASQQKVRENACGEPTCHRQSPGGDCEHMIGLHGQATDEYGKPVDWCWWCWKQRQLAQLQAPLAERVAEVGELNVQLRDARQDAARLREAAHNLTCEVCKMDMQKALKGA